MRWFKGIFLLIVANLLIFFTLAVTGTILINFVLPQFGIDLRGSVYTYDFAWAMVFGFGGAFISLWLSKFLVKRSYKMQQVIQPSTAKEKLVFESVQELSRRSNIKMPEVWVYLDDAPNAFATGPTRNRAMVAVSSGLVNNLRDKEVRAVLAHEIGHVTNGDMIGHYPAAGFDEHLRLFPGTHHFPPHHGAELFCRIYDLYGTTIYPVHSGHDPHLLVFTSA